eukprot:CAMPEP_0170610890 /NCGR_PEP_ID=MMETSP0224-20130122/22901_1 /TAXON_ID=285029 /ORGANISM="Togula jolla, Strain CCCM 725" /LENGTH=118 /DNA_ID=CAMNT_0010936297 /DNA_START=809 /DNA_END=1165 /DNA_ORIENTATION=+
MAMLAEAAAKEDHPLGTDSKSWTATEALTLHKWRVIPIALETPSRQGVTPRLEEIPRIRRRRRCPQLAYRCVCFSRIDTTDDINDPVRNILVLGHAVAKSGQVVLHVSSLTAVDLMPS